MKIHTMKDEIFVRKNYNHYPIYAGFIQEVLKNKEVTLGKSEGNYTYKELQEFAESIERKFFAKVVVHYPKQCSAGQKVYLVSNVGQDQKSHIYFVYWPKEDKSCVMK